MTCLLMNTTPTQTMRKQITKPVIAIATIGTRSKISEKNKSVLSKKQTQRKYNENKSHCSLLNVLLILFQNFRLTQCS